MNQKENELWLLSQRRDCIQLEIAGAARALFDQPLTFSTDVFPMFQRARLEQSCLEQRIVCCNQLREPALSCNGAPHPGAAFAGDFHRPAFNMRLRRRSDDAAKTLDEMIGPTTIVVLIDVPDAERLGPIRSADFGVTEDVQRNDTVAKWADLPAP